MTTVALLEIVLGVAGLCLASFGLGFALGQTLRR
jgi:hypothetical protein